MIISKGPGYVSADAACQRHNLVGRVAKAGRCDHAVRAAIGPGSGQASQTAGAGQGQRLGGRAAHCCTRYIAIQVGPRRGDGCQTVTAHGHGLCSSASYWSSGHVIIRKAPGYVSANAARQGHDLVGRVAKAGRSNHAVRAAVGPGSGQSRQPGSACQGQTFCRGSGNCCRTDNAVSASAGIIRPGGGQSSRTARAAARQGDGFHRAGSAYADSGNVNVVITIWQTRGPSHGPDVAGAGIAQQQLISGGADTQSAGKSHRTNVVQLGCRCGCADAHIAVRSYGQKHGLAGILDL